MTARTSHLVRGGGRFPTEPHPWHRVERVDGNTYTTVCGEHITDPKNESEPGEPVPNLTGKTVCYGCANTPTEGDR